MEPNSQPPVHSIESVYNKLSDAYHNVANMRIKLEYLLEGTGEYPSGDSDHPLVSQPSIKIVGEETGNIFEQINLCNKLVDMLKDGGSVGNESRL